VLTFADKLQWTVNAKPASVDPTDIGYMSAILLALTFADKLQQTVNAKPASVGPTDIGYMSAIPLALAFDGKLQRTSPTSLLTSAKSGDHFSLLALRTGWD